MPPPACMSACSRISMEKNPVMPAKRESLINEYSATPYAGMAGLMLARLDFEAGDVAKARERLQWVLEHADDAAVKHAARLRLARIHLGSGNKEADRRAHLN